MTYQALDDLYAYAIARGWYASTCGSGPDYSLPCVRKDEYVIVFDSEMDPMLIYGRDDNCTCELPATSLANAYKFIDTH